MKEIIHQHFFEVQTLHFSTGTDEEQCWDEEEKKPEEHHCGTGEDAIDGKLFDCNAKMSCEGPGDTSTCKITSESLIKDHESCQKLIQSVLHSSIKISPKNISRPKRARACISYSTSAKITIYYYKSTIFKDLDKGCPIVLNFSDSNFFLKCCCEGDNANLSIECCDKEKLQSICEDDPKTWPFVFYMKILKDNNRLFESAVCRGWFILTKSPDTVTIGKQSNPISPEFYFDIFSTCNTAPGKSM